MKLNYFVVVALSFLAACSMQQDPLVGAPDVVRQGVPPDTDRPASVKPLPKEAMQIDVPTLVNGRVGIPLEFKVTGRIMTPNVPFKIKIDNLDEFPGAIFDQSTGEFKWTPSKTILANSPSVEIPMHISLITEPTVDNPVITVEKKHIILNIVNLYSKPIINSILGTDPIVTGTRHLYQVQLEDADALNYQDVTINVRDCSSIYGTASISHMVLIRKIEEDPSAPNRYKAEIQVDLTASEALRTGRYCFALMAVSKHGVVSDIYKKDVYIEIKMRATKITTEVLPSIKVGEKAFVSFAIYDPIGAGNLNLKSMDDINTMLPGSTMNCRTTIYAESHMHCEGVIDTTRAFAQNYNFKITVENTGYRPTQSVVNTHTVQIPVKVATP